MALTELSKEEIEERKQKHLAEIRGLEEAGERAFNDTLCFSAAITSIDDGMDLPYRYDAFIRGYWRGREKKLCVDNPDYLKRHEKLKFSEGTTITVVLKVLNENETPSLLGAMYHHDDPSSYVAGCEAISICKGDLRDQIEDIRRDIYNITEKHGIVGISGR